MKIRIELDYKCFPVWMYDDNNKLVTNDLPEYLIGDEPLDPLFTEIQKTYDNLFVDNKTEFKFVGFTSAEEKNKFLDNIMHAYNLLKEKVNNDATVEIDLENFPCEKLIEIVEKGLDIELIEDAMQKLSDIDENYALAKGIAFLKDGSFDPYFQACIFDFVYDLDKEAVLDCVLSRKLDIDSYFFKDILRTMTVHTSHEDFVKMKNHKNVLGFLLTQYEKYDENAKDEMIDLVKEFNENFHTNTFFKELT